ncbi:MAG TPA: MFS transporter, partial [Terriglobales bacterium]|nr:MFS transporter [Terriglobales bacterium]
AALGMTHDLGFSDRVFGLGVGVFFIGYVALQVPGTLLVDRWSARRMISLTLITWGLLTALTALVHTPGQLYFARLVLGASEAAFFPGMVVYLSHWFVRADRAKSTSRFMAAIPLSFVIGSPIAGWILSHDWFTVEGWRWLFVLEGIPAIFLGAVAFFYLADRPRDAAWLSLEQREWITKKLEEENAVNRQLIGVGQMLRSRIVVVLTSVAFLAYFSTYAVYFWFPLILKRQSGLSNLWIGIYGAIPYAAAFAAMLIGGWHSDKKRERHWHAAVPLLIGAAGLMGLIHLPTSTALTVALFSTVCVSMGFLPTFWAIPTEILSETTAASAVGMINAIASIAGFAAPYAFGYLQTRTGTLAYGFAMLMVSALAGAALLLTPWARKESK